MGIGGMPSLTNPSAPAVENPYNVAQLGQGVNAQSGLQSQAGSMVNQSTPYGSLNYIQTGVNQYGQPIYSANSSLSPQQQQLLNTMFGTQQVAGGLAPGNITNATTQLNTAGAYQNQGLLDAAGAYGTTGGASGMLPTASNTLSGALGYLQPASNTLNSATSQYGSTASPLLGFATNQFQGYNGQNPSAVIGGATSGNTQSMVNNMVSYMSPFFDQQTEKLDTQLRNQGFAPGQPGYDNAMGNLQKSQGASVTNAVTQFEPIAYNQAETNFMIPSQLGTAAGGVGGTAASAAGTLGGIGAQQGALTGQAANVGAQQGTLASILNSIAGTQNQIAGTTGQLGNNQASIGSYLQNFGMQDMAAAAPQNPNYITTPGLNITPANVGNIFANQNTLQNQQWQDLVNQTSANWNDIANVASAAIPKPPKTS